MTCPICSHDQQRDDGACAGCDWLTLKPGVDFEARALIHNPGDSGAIVEMEQGRDYIILSPTEALRLARYILARLGGEEVERG